MTDIVKALLQQRAIEGGGFGASSRYYGLPTATVQGPNGEVLRYVRRRFIPPASRFTVIREYVAREGDRLDNIAAHSLGDPEQYWRLCDANEVLRPEELEEPGREMRVTLPAGLTGISNA